MSFEIFLTIGTLLMVAVMLYAGRIYKVQVWKRIASAVLLTAAGVIGAKLMAFIESGSFSGRSFFGALFFAPLIMVPAAKLLKIDISDMLDLCAPCECIMLAFLKVDCFIEGCCKGRVLYITETGEKVRFPSQIVECLFAVLLMLILLRIMVKKKNRGVIYPMYMLLYGFTRFILNLLRETEPFIWILPAGNFWSIISMISGIVWMSVYEERHTKSRKRKSK